MIRIGANPIGWSNDDMRELGGATPLEVCLAEAREAGFEGMELGHKFPREPKALAAVLAKHGLSLVSGWYSGRLATRSAEEEIRAVDAHLRLLADNGATVMVYGEVADSIQGAPVPLSKRPRFFGDDAWKRYADRVTALARHTLAHGVRLAYHHHMGAYVQAPADVDTFMARVGDEVGLLTDHRDLVLSDEQERDWDREQRDPAAHPESGMETAGCAATSLNPRSSRTRST